MEETEINPEQARLSVDLAPYASCLCELDTGVLLFANQYFADLVGASHSSLAGRRVSEFYVEPERHAELLRNLQEQTEPLDTNMWLHIAGGAQRLVAPKGRLLSLQGERTVLLAFQDLMELNQANVALRVRDEQYRLMVENSFQGIWTIDVEGRTTYANQRMADILACSREDLMGSTMYDFADPDGQKEAEGNMERRAQGVAEVHEFKFIRKDGSPVWTELATSPYFDEKGDFAGGIAMIQDISERKQVEAERERWQARLRHTEKLEALGTLVSGIAHDFNNLLVPITGHAELLLRTQSPDPVLRSRLESIRLAAERASGVVQQFLTFARDDVRQLQERSVQGLVKDAVRLLRAALPASIDLRVDVGSDMGRILCDESKLSQVFLNLGANAAYATKNRGTICISAQRGTVEAGGEPLQRGEHVVIRFQDDGDGILAETLPRVFEPYFTTKPMGKGTGLGLTTVHGVIGSHGGSISVVSPPGQGTEFTILLPVASDDDRAQPTPVPVADIASAAPPVRLRVVVVDDEALALEVVELLLAEHGHEVFSFHRAEDALRFVGENPQGVDVIITDLSMPGMSGLELAEELINLDSELPIIVCTGWLAGDLKHDNPPRAIKKILLKPYRPAELMRIVMDFGAQRLR